MKRLFKPVSMAGSSSTVDKPEDIEPRASSQEVQVDTIHDSQPQTSLNEAGHQLDLDNLERDPGLRPNIMSYPPNLIEQVCRAYLLKGPCQPRGHIFPEKLEANKKGKFVVGWFDEFSTWLEYSIAKDSLFCLYCYLFSTASSVKWHDAFVSGGFCSWRKKERLRVHVGDQNSEHTRCRAACENLMNEAQHIETSLSRVSKQSKIDYHRRLNASIVSLRYCIMQGHGFRGNDESDTFLNQGNFLELLKVLASCNDDIGNVVLRNTPQNHKLTSSDIQKEIINATAVETLNAIIGDIGSSFFSILVDECRDVSVKEQMGIVVRYVNEKGCVIERFLGIVHVTDTTATSLEKGLNSFFSTHRLSISSLRGQGYDGASNMRGEFKGLKSLILKRNPSAYFVHCFAHQIQLTIVAVAKQYKSVGSFFNTISRLFNVVGGSFKHMDMLRESQREKIIQGIANNEIETGPGTKSRNGFDTSK